MFGNEEVERALLALAESSGNAEAAARMLEADGLRIDSRTLRRWRSDTHAERYATIHGEVLPKLRAKAADRHMALAELQMDVSQAMTERLGAGLEDIPVRDLPGGIRNVDTAAAINTDKAALLRDQPTQIVRRSFDEIKRELRAKGVILDGTVVDLDDERPALPVSTEDVDELEP